METAHTATIEQGNDDVLLQFQQHTLGVLSHENWNRFKFFAACYNCGFDKSFETIQLWTKKAAFPYGVKYPSNMQYCYAEVAWDYYNQK